MKTRQGFVSNSSSSSFVLVTTKAGYTEALSKLSKSHANIIKQVMSKVRFGKQDLISVAYHDYQDEGCNVLKWKGGTQPSIQATEQWDEIDNVLHDKDNGVYFSDIIKKYEKAVAQTGYPVLRSKGWS